MGSINPEKTKRWNRLYYLSHKDLVKERTKKWNVQNKEKRHLYCKKYYIDNKEKAKQASQFCKRRNQELWLDILHNKGFLTCAKCGYNTHYGAIDYHHREPSKKEMMISKFLREKVTEERLIELSKTIPLCANCHRELHAGLWQLEDSEKRKCA